MQQDDRMTAQKVLVQRMTSIVTRLVPDGSGAHLRFINKSRAGLDNLTKDGIEENMDFKPAGGTMIGTNLKRKILEPFIYNVIEQGDVLLRPYLILIVTDGDPTNEDPSKLKNAIVECGRRLTDRGYPQEGMRADCPQPYSILWRDAYKNYKAVMFLISQVGQEENAKRFLDDLEEDAGIDRVLFRTAGGSNLRP